MNDDAKAAAKLAAELLPQVLLGIQQGVELYNTIVNHPETDEALKAEYASLTASVEATRAEVNATIARVNEQQPPA